MTRRRFCQLTLATTLASTLPALPAEALSLRPTYSLMLAGEQLEVTLFLENRGSKSREVLARRGFSQSIELSVKKAGESTWAKLEMPLAKSVDELPMSRVGPRPVWFTLAPGELQNFGTFRAPFDGKGQVVELSLKILTQEGPVEFPPERAKVRVDTPW